MEDIDVAQQTTQDYSVEVTNPPINCSDLEPYYEFFSKFGEVNLISIATTNGGLLKALGDRKAVECTLMGLVACAEAEDELKLRNESNSISDSDCDSDCSSRSGSSSSCDPQFDTDTGTDIDSNSQSGLDESTCIKENEAASTEERSPIKAEIFEHVELTFLQKIGYAPTIKGCFDEIESLSCTIQKLSTHEYVPWRVFVTFNSEHAQRNCLRRTNVGLFSVFMNKSHNADVMFMNKTLRIVEPSEPNGIIYETSHRNFLYCLGAGVISYLCCGLCLLGSFYIVKTMSESKNDDNFSIAIFISVINALLPTFFKMMTLLVEVHYTARNVQASMLLKLVIARCINSAILIYVVTPFENTFSQESLLRIQNVLIGDAITTPLLRFLNMEDFLMKSFVVPFSSKTQEDYNAFYQGAKWNLAERYTDVLKTVFVGLFFLVPLPSGVFISAVAMLVTYIVDKYALLRLWRRIPNVGHFLGTISRYFCVVIVFTHSIVSRIYFANW